MLHLSVHTLIISLYMYRNVLFLEVASVSEVQICTKPCQRHESYLKLTSKQKAIVAKYATVYGVVKTIQ